MNIAIDGPSGAGKSTLAKLLARTLNITYLDTGAMYRALAVKVSSLGIDPKDCAAVEPLLKDTKIDVFPSETGTVVYVDGSNVTDEIRKHYVSKAASDVSACPAVRVFMVEMQRKIAKSKDTVLDGRDIGTYVLPNAEYKFYLTATSEVRAKRRMAELKQRGENCDFETIKVDIEKRDYNDSHREFAPLKKAEDAAEIDCTEMTIEQVLQAMLKIIREK